MGGRDLSWGTRYMSGILGYVWVLLKNDGVIRAGMDWGGRQIFFLDIFLFL